MVLCTLSFVGYLSDGRYPGKVLLHKFSKGPNAPCLLYIIYQVTSGTDI
jgi:hypothetical protein